MGLENRNPSNAKHNGKRKARVFSKETQSIWWAIEVMRILVHNRKKWGQRFTSTCAAVLRPEQRVTLPGEAARVGWLGGDVN